jgi:hypothetical protein
MAGECGVPDLEGRYWDATKLDQPYGPVLLQTATLLKLLTCAKHRAGGEQFKWDKTNHSTLKARLEDLRFGGERVVESGKSGFYESRHGVFVFNDPHFGHLLSRGLPKSHFHGKVHLRMDLQTMRNHLCSR